MVSMDQREASFRGADLRLFVRDVRDRQAKKRSITVRSWATIKDVKDLLQTMIHIPPSAQRLYFGPLLTSGSELPNHRTLHDAGIYRSGETLLLDIKDSPCAESSLFSMQYTNDICISSCMMDSTPKALRSIVQEARRGLSLGLKPDLVLDGSGGTYFLRDARKNKIAVFKPADEEPYAENNPRGYLPQAGQRLSLREGIAPGEACVREVAAYLLDHEGFSGVPMTTLVEARHPAFNSNGLRLKVSEGGASVGSHSLSPQARTPNPTKAGSLQEFIYCDCSMDDMSPSKICSEEVHKVAILDIRLMNADRNSANLLVRRRRDGGLELVPIDHGYCLRSVCDVSWMDWCWLDWPQLKQPLSDKHKKYIMELDIDADARLLQDRLNLCQEATDYFRASSLLLKAGVKAGWTLYDIAILCCRNDNLGETPSVMEKFFSTASELAHIAIENERWHHTAASRALVEQLSPPSLTVGKADNAGARHRFRKSVSSVEFGSSREDSLEPSLDDDLMERDAPGMAQSSGSDSSSDGDAGDAAVETDECEEWAALVIADVAVGQILPVSHRSGRCSSIASDDASSDSGLSASPRGFWHIRPGTSPAFSDDGSVTWSPYLSPRNCKVVDFSSPPPETIGPIPPRSTAKTNMVSFARELPDEIVLPPAVINVSGRLLLPPPMLNVSKFKTNASDDGGHTAARDDGGMARSKSYSALSAALDGTRDKGGVPKRNTRQGYTKDDALYRKYLHKFIDLVVVRETAAARKHLAA